MKTSLQCVTVPADKRASFVSRDASGVVTFRNPEGVYPRLFKVAPIRFLNLKDILLLNKRKSFKVS